MSSDENNYNSDLYAVRGSEHRLKRQAQLTQMLVSSEGQPLRIVLLQYSKQFGKSLRTVSEYFDVISEDNTGPIYEKNGIIHLRKPLKKYLRY